jgi:hypothetical protein
VNEEKGMREGRDRQRERQRVRAEGISLKHLRREIEMDREGGILERDRGPLKTVEQRERMIC